MNAPTPEFESPVAHPQEERTFPTPDEYLSEPNLDHGVLYYPGSGTDCGPLLLFAEHVKNLTVVYTDYNIDLVSVNQLLNHLVVWQSGAIQNLAPQRFGVVAWADFWHPSALLPAPNINIPAPEISFGIETTLTHANGKKINFIFLATEAVGTFSVLANANLQPTAIVLQDHGFGGNWTSFGGDSELWRLARVSQTLPDLLFVAENTNPWTGYECVSNYGIHGCQEHQRRRAVFTLSDYGKENN